MNNSPLTEALLSKRRLECELAAATRNRCDACGAKIIDKCVCCGAPQCCPQCCRIDELERELAAAKERNAIYNDNRRIDDREHAATIDALRERLSSVAAERDRLDKENDELADEVIKLTKDGNTMYLRSQILAMTAARDDMKRERDGFKLLLDVSMAIREGLRMSRQHESKEN
jgi:hypothetical protein